MHRVKKSLNVLNSSRGDATSLKSNWKSEMNLGLREMVEAAVSKLNLLRAWGKNAHSVLGVRVRKRLAVLISHVLE